MERRYGGSNHDHLHVCNIVGVNQCKTTFGGTLQNVDNWPEEKRRKYTRAHTEMLDKEKRRMAELLRNEAATTEDFGLATSL